MRRVEGRQLLKGVVEASEAYLGGRPRYGRSVRAYWSKKIMLVGAVERGGRVSVRIAESKSRGAVYKALVDMVKRGAKLFTSQYNFFTLLGWYFLHRRRKFALSGIENFWDSVKWGYYATHHRL